jgi:hypothetical protein
MSASTQRFDPTFYATIAQVIPLLFVLLFVELGVVRRGERIPARAAPFMLSVLVLLVGGEAVALYAVREGQDPGPAGEAVVAGALIWSAMVAFIVVGQPITSAISGSRAGGLGLVTYFAGAVVALSLHTLDVIAFPTFVALVALAPVAVGVMLPALFDVARDVRRAVERRPEQASSKGRHSEMSARDILIAVAVLIIARSGRRRDRS